MDMEAALAGAAAGRIPDDLYVCYSDMHGLWGGVTVTAGPAGAYERAERRQGDAEPAVVRGTLAPAQLQDLARLLLEIRAWEQRTPEAPPLPDESRATLVIRCAGAKSSIWERHND